MERDLKHLRLLRIFQYIFAGICALGVLRSIYGLAVTNDIAEQVHKAIEANPEMNKASPQFEHYFGTAVYAMTIFGVVFGIVLAVLALFVGLCLSRRKGRVFIIVSAALECVSIPLGTILGVFTLIVVNRLSVKALFQGKRPEGIYPFEIDQGSVPPIMPQGQ